MDLSTITFLAGIISCCIGLATFVTGMNARAQKEGALEQKLNQAIQGIDDIKEELKTTSQSQNSMALLVQSHVEQLKTVFRQMDGIDKQVNTLGNFVNISEVTNKAIVNILDRMEKKVGNNESSKS